MACRNRTQEGRIHYCFCQSHSLKLRKRPQFGNDWCSDCFISPNAVIASVETIGALPRLFDVPSRHLPFLAELFSSLVSSSTSFTFFDVSERAACKFSSSLFCAFLSAKELSLFSLAFNLFVSASFADSVFSFRSHKTTQ